MTNLQAVEQQPTQINGLDVQTAHDTIEAIKADKSLARFKFRARNTWISGGTNRSTIRDFYGAGREDDSRTEDFVFTNGEPPILLGNNEGGNPVEFLLHALAGCVTTTFVLHAMARGINIMELSTQLEGDMDLQGLLGLDDSVSPGYEEIRIKLNVRADCSDEQLEDLLAYTEQHSPVCNTVCRPVPVRIERAVAQ
ncbi:MAG: OsmC family protein [Alphaproteobacteria bacterium]